MYNLIYFFYSHKITRGILKLLSFPCFSSFFGFLMSRKISCLLIPKFIRDHEIDLSLYEEKKYRSFNDFFTRKIRPECRPYSETGPELISPCDGYLSAFRVTDDLHTEIKGVDYTVPEIFGEDYGEEFHRGTFLLFRLTPGNYHRYHFFDDGTLSEMKNIKGRLNTVNPIVHRYAKVFRENKRTVSVLQTAHFGKVVMAEVGALFVGGIKNREVRSFCRGEEKGYFDFAGSSILLLLKPGIDVFEKYFGGNETEVFFGETIGKNIADS